jgi:tRNA 2-selenouridine synthase
MIQRLTIQDLMNIQEPIPLLDVRAPAEFSHGHMPGAVNLPLFSNEERAQVGTVYHQEGRESAILMGFDLTGPKWSGLIRQALEMAPGKRAAVHCWRGGMRSSAIAWALDLFGFKVYLVDGGYKSYRRWVLRQFSAPYDLCVIGGMTGSGKTKTLQKLQLRHEQIIDIEALAQHCGSTYGTLNRLVQPTQEQFENDLADHLHRLDPGSKIWIEDESVTIGKCLIPPALWVQMQGAPLWDLQVPIEDRINFLVKEYGSLDPDFLVESTIRIRKRLGLEQAKLAISAIREGRMAQFIKIVLVYYDKMYQKGLTGRSSNRIVDLPVVSPDPSEIARQILESAQVASVTTGN